MVMPPLEGRLLRSRLLSWILAFRCSRVVINGTRSAMGFALFLLERRKKYLLLYLVSAPALFWATGGKICLVYNCDTTKYPDIGDTIRMRKKNILEKRYSRTGNDKSNSTSPGDHCSRSSFDKVICPACE
jgi:hypothetical protein